MVPHGPGPMVVYYQENHQYFTTTKYIMVSKPSKPIAFAFKRSSVLQDHQPPTLSPSIDAISASQIGPSRRYALWECLRQENIILSLVAVTDTVQRHVRSLSGTVWN